MQKHTLQFAIKKPFGNLFRARCVLIAAQNSEGNVLLGAKPHFYPPTIARLLGGGVDAGETYQQAALRELHEELGVHVSTDSLIPLLLFTTTAIDENGQEYTNNTTVFKVNIGSQPYQAGDDVKHILTFTPEELHELGNRYNELPDTLWYNGQEGLYAWADYAKMYGPIHTLTAEHLL